MDAVLEPPSKLGSRLKGKALVAQALLSDGHSIRSAANISGISKDSARLLAHQQIVPPSHIEPVKKSLRDRMAMLADFAINGIDETKIRDASALECMKVADLAMKNAGLAPPSVTESYSFSVSKYLTTNEAVSVLKTDSNPQAKTQKKVS